MATFQDVQDKVAALSDDDFLVGIASHAPATEAEIAALETRAGLRLPDELRKLLLAWSFLVVEVKDSVWPRAVAHDVLPAWRFSHGFKVLGVASALLPENRVTAALTPALVERRAVPVLQRFGAGFTHVATAKGMATWSPADTELDPIGFDVMEVLLDEISALEEGISRLRAARATVPELMERGRADDWDGPAISDLVDALKEAPAAELAPHLKELAMALLPEGSHSMGCLDVIAAAGPTHFATVAADVHAHFGEGDDPYVIELLGKVGDLSPEATKIYAIGLTSDDEDVFDYTVGALRANASAAGARALMDEVKRRLEGDFDEPARKFALIGLVGHLGGNDLEVRVRAALEEVADDHRAFSDLVSGLDGLDLGGSPLAPLLLHRLRTMKPEDTSTFNTSTMLVELGIEDAAFMGPVARVFREKGGMWAERAERLLARWPDPPPPGRSERAHKRSE